MTDGSDGKGIKVDVHLHMHFTVTTMERSSEISIGETVTSFHLRGNPNTELGKHETPYNPEAFQAMRQRRMRNNKTLARMETLGKAISESLDRSMANLRKAASYTRK